MPNLHITIKFLNDSRECTILIDSKEFVSNVKRLVAERFYVSSNEQKIIFDGKALSDDESLENQNVKDGCKLHLIVKKSPCDVKFAQEFHKYLSDRYSPSECKKICDKFEDDLCQTVSNASWDDLERYATKKLEKN